MDGPKFLTVDSKKISKCYTAFHKASVLILATNRSIK